MRVAFGHPLAGLPLAYHNALGQPLKTKEHVELALQLKPDFTMRQFETIFPYRDSKVRKEFLTGLQKAGYPERILPKSPLFGQE